MKTAKDLELSLLLKEKKIQDLQLELQRTESINKEYTSRLIKAIEYIEQQTKELYKNWDIENFDFKKLLDILKGVNYED